MNKKNLTLVDIHKESVTYIPGWIRITETEDIFDVTATFFIKLRKKDSSFPKPVILGKTSLWNTQELIDYFSKKTSAEDRLVLKKPEYLSEKDILGYVKIPRMTFSYFLKKGDFPSPIKTYTARKYFRVEDIDNWINEKNKKKRE